MKTYDIAIIGAGIVGAACAFRLSKEGFRVAVIEAREPAGGSTSAGMGHLVVMDDSEAQFALTNYSGKLWREISPELPPDCEYEQCGTIWVAADEEEMSEVRRKKDFYESNGVAASILSEQELREAEPNLRRGLPGGLHVPSDKVVYQLCATQFFLEKALGSGARIFTGNRAVKISERGVELAGGETVHAERIVNAAGIGASRLTENLSIAKRKGHLVITERHVGFVGHQLIELGYLKSAHASEADSVAFNVQPRLTGQVLIGSSRQFGAEDAAVDFQILRKMIDRAVFYMPDLRDFTAVRVWTGFRPATPDNLPYIGRHPEFENVYLAAGHEGLGITTSLGTAELLNDEISGRESAIDRKPYSPERLFSNTV